MTRFDCLLTRWNGKTGVLLPAYMEAFLALIEGCRRSSLDYRANRDRAWVDNGFLIRVMSDSSANLSL